MTPEEKQLEAGVAALEGQRALLGDAVVDSALRADAGPPRRAARRDPARRRRRRRR